ncbi:hypothetical protein ABZ554_25365 [Streptomyces sp. NPDC020125]|uniref:hypothetical protein n=1 Tax=Streptomyces sp. NPDC020125 TaxID=3154593 RepID=UPI003406E6FC
MPSLEILGIQLELGLVERPDLRVHTQHSAQEGLAVKGVLPPQQNAASVQSSRLAPSQAGVGRGHHHQARHSAESLVKLEDVLGLSPDLFVILNVLHHAVLHVVVNLALGYVRDSPDLAMAVAA